MEDIITQLAAVQAAITGVEAAYDETPDSLSEFPCFVNFPGSGTLHWARSTGGESFHTIICQLRVSRTVTEEAELLARPFVERFRDALAAAMTLNGTVATINEVRYTWVTFPTGREEHMGIQFEVDVKEETPDLTVNP